MSIGAPSRFLVMRPWPMPSVIEEPSDLSVAGRVIAVERRAHRIGERDRTSLLRSLSAMPTPASVPPVPTAQMKPSTLPSVCPRFPARWSRDGPAGWRRCRTGWPRPRRSVRSSRKLLGEAAGELHVIVRVGVGDGRHLDQFGAAEPQHVLLLLALRVRDDDHAAKAERVADQRKADAGIAGGAFDDHAARLELAALHRVLR